MQVDESIYAAAVREFCRLHVQLRLEDKPDTTQLSGVLHCQAILIIDGQASVKGRKNVISALEKIDFFPTPPVYGRVYKDPARKYTYELCVYNLLGYAWKYTFIFDEDSMDIRFVQKDCIGYSALLNVFTNMISRK